MTPEDRELLQTIRRQQMDLQRSLARLESQIEEIEARTTTAPVTELHSPFPPPFIPPNRVDEESRHELPPLPIHASQPPLPPPVFIETTPPPLTVPIFLTAQETAETIPPLPPPASPFPSEPPLPPVPGPSLEYQLGRWLTRIGAVLFVILLISADSYFKFHALLGPWGKLGAGAVVSMLVAMFGQRLERKNPGMLFFARTLFAAGLAGLYVTLYAACSYEPLRVITNPFLAGLVLLSWSVYVFYLAEQRSSQTFSLFAITLAYFSTAVNPIGHFTMAADLILAATAVVFFIRNGWSTLSYFSLAGTYYALLRRLVLGENGELVLDTSRTLHFWPHAIYLIGAWLIFTAAVILSTAPSFRGGKRLAFLTLNNGALAGFLLLITYLTGHGHGPMGWALLASGAVLLITSRIAGLISIESERVMTAYAAQGLLLVTFGLIVLNTGVTRGVVLLLETLFLGIASNFSRDVVLVASTYVAGFFATIFLIFEIAVHAHHPWLLGFGGAAVMLLNAWWSRSELRHDPKARSTIVLSSSYYSALALGLIFTAIYTQMSDNYLPPTLALATLVLTFAIYFCDLYELPPLAQILLLAAQGLVLFPVDTGESLPWWTTASVAGVTLIMLTWWSRQQITRPGSWVIVLNIVYALALAGLTYETVQPRVDAQNWMISAALLSVAFLLWGAFSRIWSIAAVGQLFLALAVYHFFAPYNLTPVYPWTWWAAALPIVVVFSTARATHNWLNLFTNITGDSRLWLRLYAYGYQIVALIMIIRWVTAFVAPINQTGIFLALGMLLMAWNIRAARHVPDSSTDEPTPDFGIRSSYILSLFGLWVYLMHLDNASQNTNATALAFLGFLLQPAFLQGRKLVDPIEVWALILVSAGAGWVFASEWVSLHLGSHYMTLGWAAYALILFLVGFVTSEKRQRWCGLVVLIAAIIRVFCYDFWGLSNGYRVLTFLVLTLVTLGFGYMILRNADSNKKQP